MTLSTVQIAIRRTGKIKIWVALWSHLKNGCMQGWKIILSDNLTIFTETILFDQKFSNLIHKFGFVFKKPNGYLLFSGKIISKFNDFGGFFCDKANSKVIFWNTCALTISILLELLEQLDWIEITDFQNEEFDIVVFFNFIDWCGKFSGFLNFDLTKKLFQKSSEVHSEHEPEAEEVKRVARETTASSDPFQLIMTGFGLLFNKLFEFIGIIVENLVTLGFNLYTKIINANKNWNVCF